MSNAQYTTVAVKKVPASVHDLSRSSKLSFNMGELIPIMVEEVVPNDTFKVRQEVMIRLAPMLAPVMHKINVWVHSFYCPNRILWDEWNDHISGGEDGTANPAFPKIVINQAKANQYFRKGSLADYLGIPPYDGQAWTENIDISALPFRMYASIYNEYFRDQDLQDKVAFEKTSGNISDIELAEIAQIRKRAWEKDYFTSARPTAQKGATARVPINQDFSQQQLVVDSAGNPITNYLDGNGLFASQADGTLQHESTAGINQAANIDLGENAEINITDLRASNKLQEWLELASRGGTRINELIRNFFGVTPDDLRLDRPQWLGSSAQPVVLSEVLNTAGDQGSTLQPLGEYGGHGVSVGSSAGFKKRFKEHGYVMSLISVLPKTEYHQGLHRHWQKFDKYERYWPQFQNIGEQAIKSSEIFLRWGQTLEANESTFGYAPRYAEYKSCASAGTIHGDFHKDSIGDNLSYWHMGRHFDTAPALNAQFVESDPTERIFAVQDSGATDKLYCQIFHKVRAKRPMTKFSIPSLI